MSKDDINHDNNTALSDDSDELERQDDSASYSDLTDDNQAM